MSGESLQIVAFWSYASLEKADKETRMGLPRVWSDAASAAEAERVFVSLTRLKPRLQ